MKKKSVKAVSDSLTRALAGKPPEEIAEPKAADQPPAVEPKAEPEPKAEEPSKPDVAPKAEVTPKAEVAPETNALVEHLKNELKDVRKENSEIAAKLSLAQADVTKVTAEFTSLKIFAENASKAVRQMTERLSIGLGVHTVGLDNLSGESLLAMWTSVKDKFDKNFLSGGKSVSDASDQGAEGPALSSTKRRGVKATQLS